MYENISKLNLIFQIENSQMIAMSAGYFSRKWNCKLASEANLLLNSKFIRNKTLVGIQQCWTLSWRWIMFLYLQSIPHPKNNCCWFAQNDNTNEWRKKSSTSFGLFWPLFCNFVILYLKSIEMISVKITKSLDYQYNVSHIWYQYRVRH